MIDSSSRTLAIHQPLTLTSLTASPWPDAVNSRSYGLNGTTLQFNATNGIPPYVSYIGTGLSPDFTCSILNPSAGSCSSGGITAAPGSYNNVAVTVVDTGNASTPASTASSDPNSVSANSLNVDAALSMTPTTLPNGLVNYPYPTNFGAATLTATGGLGGNTWLPPGSLATLSCPSTTGSFPPGTFALSPSSNTASISGTPSTASASAGSYAFQICVTDAGNIMTPAGDDLKNLVIDVMAPYAVIAEKGADEIEFFDTSAKLDSTVVAQPISTGLGTAPYAVAFSPSGRYAYVAFSGKDEL
ncbi:MAG: hypothetical protein ACREJM_07210, partial [Candidatus Saccharimonadales bacterium]